MQKPIFLKATNDEGETSCVKMYLTRIGDKVKVKAFDYDAGEKVGEVEITLENFNNFCLDLFSEHKRILNEK